MIYFHKTIWVVGVVVVDGGIEVKMVLSDIKEVMTLDLNAGYSLELNRYVACLHLSVDAVLAVVAFYTKEG